MSIFSGCERCSTFENIHIAIFWIWILKQVYYTIQITNLQQLGWIHNRYFVIHIFQTREIWVSLSFSTHRALDSIDPLRIYFCSAIYVFCIWKACFFISEFSAFFSCRYAVFCFHPMGFRTSSLLTSRPFCHARSNDEQLSKLICNLTPSFQSQRYRIDT